MHYLGLALYAEGANDYRFLCPLLLRLCEDVCAQATQRVDIGDVLALSDPSDEVGAPRAERIAKSAIDASSAWNLLFVHADADSDAEAAFRDRVLPGLELVRDAGIGRVEGIAVVPVRETEAWTLADGDALRAVLGTTLGDQDLGIGFRGRALERVTDPKQMLNIAFAAAQPRGRRSRVGVSHLLNALGEQVALNRLRDLPSFAKVESELRSALRRMQILA